MMINIRSLFKDNKTNVWITYYIILGIIQALWTNPSTFPPLPFRLLMVGLVFGPMLFKKQCVIFGIPFFLILRGQLSTDYQYLPDIHSYNFYIPLLLILLLIHCRKIQIQQVKVFLPLITMIFYMWVVDLLGVGSCGNYVINLFIALLFSTFLSSKEDSNILACALIAICALLAVYYLLMYDKFLETWNYSEGIERSSWNDPNYFSTLLSVGFFLSSLQLLNYINTGFFLYNKYTLVVLMCICYLAIVLTASRSGFLVSSIILIIIIMSKSRLHLSTLLYFILISFAFIYFMYVYGAFDTLIYRMFEQGNMDTAGNRTTIWQEVVQNYQMQPFYNQVFGGGYWHRVKLSGGMEMHNELMAIWADYGYVGLAIFISLIVSMISSKNTSFNIRLISTFFYVMMILSLSPFQYVNIGFFIVWIFSQKSSLSWR